METCRLQPPLPSPPIVGVSSKKATTLPMISRFPKHLGLQLAKQNLLNEAEKGFKKNLACSPLSIATIMNMLTAGSSKHGLKDKLSSLGCETMDELDNQSLQLIDVVSSKDTWETGDPLLTFTNGFWIDQRFSLKPSFTEILQNIYKVEPKALDFENNKVTSTLFLFLFFGLLRICFFLYLKNKT